MGKNAERLILDQAGLQKTLQALARAIEQSEKDGGSYHLVGIHTRGVPIARRLVALLKRDPKDIGMLDINLYRDDLSTVADMPVVKQTSLPFSLNGTRVLLIDDVLYTGRTTRAALDALTDLGRPRKIELLALTDRGGRELPIQADFCGETLKVADDEVVKVRLQEIDGVDEVVVAPLPKA